MTRMLQNLGTLILRLDTPAEDWNQYVACRGGTWLFHRAEWSGVFAVYGLKLERLAAIRDGRAVGILPVVWQRSVLFGNQLVSLPWFDASGILADDEEARDALVRAVLEIARQRRIPHVHLRQLQPLPAAGQTRTDKVLMRLDLCGNADRLWKSFSPKVRNQVRKAEKSGLTVERGGVELARAFFPVYARNMRDLGSPSHHFRLFQAVASAFADETRIYVVRAGGHIVGAAWTMANGDRLEVPWASSLREYNACCVNHLMYWQVMSDACRQGFAWLHFGRSTRDSGTYHFKKQWGAEERPLYWHCLSARVGTPAPAIPQERYGWGSRLWQRLPLWLARRAGPHLIAGIP